MTFTAVLSGPAQAVAHSGATRADVGRGLRAAPSPGRGPEHVGGDLWVRPIDPWVLERTFEAPATRFSAGHRGIDLTASPGTPVLAVDTGTVTFAGTVVDRPLISLRTSTGELASMEPVRASEGIVAGSDVARGSVIGSVADGGHCAARCIHLGVRVHGDYVNPMLYFGGVTRAVLLPWR